jgi:pyruvate formate lyase activating enzyme
VRVYIDGIEFKVPRNVTVAKALELIGISFNPVGSGGVSLACRTGGCWACAVVIDSTLERSCITPVRDGMRVGLDVEGFKPLRIVHGPEPHLVGGKGTPWWEVNYLEYVETAVWVAGCNLRCPQCQNYHVTYDNVSTPMTPEEVGRLVIHYHRRYRTKGIAISGGEPTINRRWLVEFFRYVSSRVESRVRKHLDSNGTVLTRDYIDELVDVGCNNIGVEPKCVRVETYMRVTGIDDRELAMKYLQTAWEAVKYIYDNYRDRVYLGVGLIYNKDLITLDEVAEAGDKIYSIDPTIQVTVLDYFPTFRRRWLRRPTVNEMLEVKKVLEDRGLKTVIVQTEVGHIGPRDRRLT